ncbi:hypothetical protein Fmac_020628 [Flemingia macrophylla]|uniref:Uncharacterized protein n=1 Tax=Flemingia macrophylla TaxID=520843 RepID=A0ABD1LUS2_9FABA
MQDNSDYTALALAADLTGNVKVANCMVERKGGRELLTMKTKHKEIPVLLLSAAKRHKQMTQYLHRKTKTKLDAFNQENSHHAVLLLTRCITAEIFDVALNLEATYS